MHVSTVWWLGLVLSILLLLAIDLLSHRGDQVPKTADAARWVGLFCGAALAFAGALAAGFGVDPAGQFLAGWLTEYSLSVDNLFIFLVMMARFSVPDPMQLRVLTIGIVLALVLRAGLIAIGAAALSRFSWLFLIFGGFLLWTAWGMLRERSRPAHRPLVVEPAHAVPALGTAAGGMPADQAVTLSDREQAPDQDNRLLRWLEGRLPTTRRWHGSRLWTRERGRLVLTPLVLTMAAIAFTDLLFALDSIPAIFGITREPYLVIAANAFALLGLRQLYFLVGALVRRLIYLSKGLAVVLAFIGVKLILEALHDNSLRWINAGEPVSWAPHIPTPLSLAVVAGTLGCTAVASLVRTRSEPSGSTAQSAEPEGARALR